MGGGRAVSKSEKHERGGGAGGRDGDERGNGFIESGVFEL